MTSTFARTITITILGTNITMSITVITNIAITILTTYMCATTNLCSINASFLRILLLVLLLA